MMLSMNPRIISSTLIASVLCLGNISGAGAEVGALAHAGISPLSALQGCGSEDSATKYINPEDINKYGRGIDYRQAQEKYYALSNIALKIEEIKAMDEILVSISNSILHSLPEINLNLSSEQLVHHTQMLYPLEEGRENSFTRTFGSTIAVGDDAVKLLSYEDFQTFFSTIEAEFMDIGALMDTALRHYQYWQGYISPVQGQWFQVIITYAPQRLEGVSTVNPNQEGVLTVSVSSPYVDSVRANYVQFLGAVTLPQ